MDKYRERMIEASRIIKNEKKSMAAEIIKIYEKAAEDMAKEAARRDIGTLTHSYCIGLSRSLKERSRELWAEIESSTINRMPKAAKAGINVQTSFLKDAAQKFGLNAEPKIQAVFTKTDEKAIEYVLSGRLYSGKRATLSKRIWNNEALQNGQIEQIITGALAKNQSAIQLAKSLESYLKPGIVQPDNWNDIYPDLPFTYKVDYNAKRLAVTAINHAAYGAALIAARENPFADYIHWELTSAHVIYDVCDGYAEHDEGLGPGNYPIDAAPIPHPFCTCLWYTDTDKSLDEIGRELNEWVYGGENERIELGFIQYEEDKGFSSPIYKHFDNTDTEHIKKFIPDIRGNETVLTNERKRHIEKRRGKEFFEKYEQYFEETLRNYELILKDANANTVQLCLPIPNEEYYLKLIVHIAVEGKNTELKHSIITVIREHRRKIMQRTNRMLYKRD